MEAQKSPEDYYNLIVRVGGYSTKFVQMDEEGQNEIMSRYS